MLPMLLAVFKGGIEDCGLDLGGTHGVLWAEGP